MVNKSKLSKGVEEQIQSLASDVYIQIEDKLTQLISSAVESSTNNKETAQQSDNYLELEKSYKISQLELSEQADSFTNKTQSFEQEIDSLKKSLVDKQGDVETHKQNFQVELTQNTINFTETIEALEKKLSNQQQERSQQQNKQQETGSQLEEKLLETEQALKDSKQEIDGLNGRIAVLTKQEVSLSKKIGDTAEQRSSDDSKLQTERKTWQEANKAQSDALTQKQQQLDEQAAAVVKLTAELESLKQESQKANDSQTQEIQGKVKALADQLQQEKDGNITLKQTLAEQLKQVETSTSQQKTLTEELQKEKNNNAALEQKLTEQVQQLQESTLAKESELTVQLQQEIDSKAKLKQELAEQLQLEQNSKAALQQELSILQRDVDTQQDQNKQLENQVESSQKKVAELAETLASEKQKQVEEQEASASQVQERQQLQETAQQAIIELEKNKAELLKQIETEQTDVKLYQQEVGALKDQVKVAEEGQENILQRFNSNREKQEKDNEKVRETIKFLRDENHDLISSHAEQNTTFNEQIHELEHKITEYRLKFEYAQKQLAN